MSETTDISGSDKISLPDSPAPVGPTVHTSPSPPPPPPAETIATAETDVEEAEAPTVTAPTAGDNDPVKLLHGLFPDYPLDIISTILDAHHGDVQSATDTLLSMSDPSFSEPAVAQMDADAELARQLHEEDARAARLVAAGPTSATPSPAPLTYQPYVPRRARAASGNATQQTPGSPARSPATQSSVVGAGDPRQKDELDQIADQFSKLAEQGKKTFGGLFNKVKDQINKLDPPVAPGGSNLSEKQQIHEREQQGWTTPSTLPRPARSTSTSFADAPNTSKPTPPTPGSVLPPLPAASAKPLDTTSDSAASTAGLSSTSSATSSSIATPTALPTSEPAAPEGPKKDFSHIGLLPRQSINLQEKKKSGNESDDSEDLEYVRSPFDDD